MPSEKSNQPEKQKPGNIFDAFVKNMFSRVVVFADFLKWYGNPDFVAAIDLRKIKLAPTHYIGKDGGERIADLVFQCPLKNGNGMLTAVIVFEHQTGSLKRIPAKLLKYISSIWDAEIREKKKTLSAPYFIVLRTGKKPIKRKPSLADFVPRTQNGSPLGTVPNFDYDVVDLPAKKFEELVGSPVLRLALGILKKTAEGVEEEFPEALLPLLEIADGEQRLDLMKDLLIFVGKVFAAHNKQLDNKVLNQALKPIFEEETETMIMSIFDRKEMEGFTRGITEGEARGIVKGKFEGKAEGKAQTIFMVLKTRFNAIPAKLQKRLLAERDSSRLDVLTIPAVECTTLKEFERALN